MYQQLKTFMEQTGTTQAQVAKALAVSAATLSLYLKNQYSGDVSKVDASVAAYLQQQARRREISKLDVGFIATPSAKRELMALSLNHARGDFGILYGDPGIGKTTLLNEYVRRHPQTVLIDPDTGFTAKVLLQEICRALGQNDVGSIHDLTVRIVDVLKDSGRMLMIDEADWLPIRALESIRRIHDKTGCAVVLAGTTKLLINLKGANSEFKQLFSRVGMKRDLGRKVSEADLRELLDKVLNLTDEKVVQAALKVADGNTRVLVKLMSNMDFLRQANRFETYNTDLVQMAAMSLVA